MHFAKENLLSRERLFLPFARVGFSFGGTFSPRTLLIVNSAVLSGWSEFFPLSNQKILICIRGVCGYFRRAASVPFTSDFML